MANGGLGNSVSREELSAALKEMGEVESLLMPPHKPYAFVTYRYTWGTDSTLPQQECALYIEDLFIPVKTNIIVIFILVLGVKRVL